MLYLRSLKLKNKGNAKNPNYYLICGFSASENKYAKVFTTTVFKQSSGMETGFVSLCEDFKIEEEDVTYPINCKETWKGEVVTSKCALHYVTDSDGEKIKGDDGKFRTANSITYIYVEEFGQTKESVLKGFERTWASKDLIIEPEEE